MKIVKKAPKSKSVACKITQEQDEKLVKLAKKLDITKSNLMAQLLGQGYKDLTKNKTF
jgi:predicted transcriptional regulator